MKSKIIKQVENPFLERDEFLFEVTNETLPTKEDIIKELGKDPELTVIKKINNNFGKNSFIVKIYVYKSKESKKKYTIIPKKVRLKLAEEKKALEAELRKKKQQEKEAKEKEAKESQIKEGEQTQDGN